MFNSFFLKKWFPLAFQILTLIFFIFLIVVGLSANTDDIAYAKILRNTNMANLIVWSYWWPFVIMFGLLFSTLLTLVVLPALYAWMEREK